STTTKQRVNESDNLTLKSVRYSLIRQEDIIIFNLVEKAQYCYNENTYDSEAFSMDGCHGSLVEYMLRETEKPEIKHPATLVISCDKLHRKSTCH
ncbi:hypothetical protein V6N11_046203, partial [Hibiscus sabdariffa]